MSRTCTISISSRSSTSRRNNIISRRSRRSRKVEEVGEVEV